ncbi:helix-turn-helix transcriptional regulator [Leptolyngbya sp. FACHB-321]|uniref:helix-turn-helix transcriptional regulator n=1 Tax=Leptolyngbya sp. FACHB-321 TaxID=2692807 RepID=UPI0016898030|nr:helix-turn-helix transcriptional regulator [Leptolyngbya sp. FACHB-321]MBD2033874.1 helix-turn-helix transcriptional regulator [Leptolyngbya sp. FACHB-321]
MVPFQSSQTGRFINEDEPIKISESEEIFLLILARGENYAGKMVDVIAECTNHTLSLNPGSYFRTLKILSDRGMVIRIDMNKEQHEAKNGKAVYYQITEMGLQALHDKEVFRQKLRGIEVTDVIPT